MSTRAPHPFAALGRRLLYAGVVLALTVLATSHRASAGAPAGCDVEFLRVQAARSVPDYEIEDLRADRGVVTIVFVASKGEGAFAVALRASGSQLSTSIAVAQVDEAEAAWASRPITAWWGDTEIQPKLVACSRDDSAITPGDAMLRAAAETVLAPYRRSVRAVVPWAAAIIGTAWVVLAFLLAGVGRPLAQTLGQKGALAALFAFSLLLHGALRSGGPGDLHLNLGAIWSPAELELRWGPAPIALFRLLSLALGGIGDSGILACNLILSGLIPLLVYAILCELGVRATAALLAAFVLTAHPFFIWSSGVLERQPTYLFAAFGSILGLASFLKRGGLSGFVAFILGTGLAITSRPEGANVLIMQLPALVFVPGTLRRRGYAIFTFGILALLGLAYVRYAMEYGTGLSGKNWAFAGLEPLRWTLISDPDLTPGAWTVFWLLGLLFGIRQRAAWIAITSLCGFHVLWSSTGLYDLFVGYARQVASARYESILLLPFAIGIALFVHTAFNAPRWLKVALTLVCVATTAMTYAQPYDVLLRPFTVDYEYRFLKRQAGALPPQSHVYVLQSPLDDTGFLDAPYIGPFVRRDVSFEPWDPLKCREPSHRETEDYLYIGSACAPLLDSPNRPLGPAWTQWIRDCASTRRRAEASTIEEIEVPARKMAWHEFADRTVRLGFYRITDMSICAADPAGELRREDH